MPLPMSSGELGKLVCIISRTSWKFFSASDHSPLPSFSSPSRGRTAVLSNLIESVDHFRPLASLHLENLLRVRPLASFEGRWRTAGLSGWLSLSTLIALAGRSLSPIDLKMLIAFIHSLLPSWKSSPRPSVQFFFPGPVEDNGPVQLIFPEPAEGSSKPSFISIRFENVDRVHLLLPSFVVPFAPFRLFSASLFLSLAL